MEMFMKWSVVLSSTEIQMLETIFKVVLEKKTKIPLPSKKIFSFF